MTEKTFKGKAIYNPSGKAGEYSYWACNFYVGCSGKCTYCYLKKGITSKILGGNEPKLKACFKDEGHALHLFCKEVDKNLSELQKHGLFFTFTSDPFLPETIYLNREAIDWCLLKNIPVKVLTKQTEWLHDKDWFDYIEGCEHRMAVGFTLTNSDEYEFGCANHLNRVSAMDYLHSKGFKTWASIEPIISIKKSIQAIADTLNICDLYKIGLESGAKYDRKELYAFYDWVGYYIQSNNNYAKVYFKDSFINRLQLNRDVLGDFCVKRDYNFWL